MIFFAGTLSILEIGDLMGGCIPVTSSTVFGDRNGLLYSTTVIPPPKLV